MRLYSHLRLPSAADKPCTRPSPVRAITVSPTTRNWPMTSLDKRIFQRAWPLTASSAISSPLPPPASTRPWPAPAPAVSRVAGSNFQTCAPFCTFKRSTLPLDTTYTASVSAAGLNTRPPASPTLAFQASLTATVGLNSTSTAGLAASFAAFDPSQPPTVSLTLLPIDLTVLHPARLSASAIVIRRKFI